MLMDVSKGGVTLDAALNLDLDDFDDWVEAALDWAKRKADAAKG